MSEQGSSTPDYPGFEDSPALKAFQQVRIRKAPSPVPATRLDALTMAVQCVVPLDNDADEEQVNVFLDVTKRIADGFLEWLRTEEDHFVHTSQEEVQTKEYARCEGCGGTIVKIIGATKWHHAHPFGDPASNCELPRPKQWKPFSERLAEQGKPVYCGNCEQQISLHTDGKWRHNDPDSTCTGLYRPGDALDGPPVEYPYHCGVCGGDVDRNSTTKGWFHVGSIGSRCEELVPVLKENGDG